MKERKAFNELLLQEKRNFDEENFDEAIAASFRACRRTEIPMDIQPILRDPKAQKLTKEVYHFVWKLIQSSHFWILTRCVADFVADPDGGNGMLPLMGGVPDMKADSSRYVLLQNWLALSGLH